MIGSRHSRSNNNIASGASREVPARVTSRRWRWGRRGRKGGRAGSKGAEGVGPGRRRSTSGSPASMRPVREHKGSSELPAASSQASVFELPLEISPSELLSKHPLESFRSMPVRKPPAHSSSSKGFHTRAPRQSSSRNLQISRSYHGSSPLLAESRNLLAAPPRSSS